MATAFGGDSGARVPARGDALGRWVGHHPIAALALAVAVIVALWLVLAPWPAGFEDVFGRKRLFINAIFNGITLGALYFLVATGFTLIFGLMRYVNLAHGSLYLFGGYMGYEAGEWTGSWLFGFVIAFISCAIVGMAMQFFIFRRMEGQDLRQTLVTLGLSIVFSDLMVWVWGGNAIQIDTPDYLMGPTPTPIVVAVKSSGDAVFLQYPRVRLVIFVAAVVIGIGMWLALHRTRIGVMIRAGVDDRDMLSVLGYRVQLLFILVFAFGAGLAGIAGIVGGTFQSISLGEDFAFSVGLAAGSHCRWHGINPWRGARRHHYRLRRTTRPNLLPELRDRSNLCDHGHRARLASARTVGETLMALAQITDSPSLGEVQRTSTLSRWASQHAAILLLGLVLLILPAVAGDFIFVQVVGWAMILGIIALSLMFLAGYGGMVSLAQMTVAGVSGYMITVFGASSLPAISLFWPWWVATPIAIAIAVAFGALTGVLSSRTEGIYTIMITLAIAAAFFYLTLQNWPIFNGFAGFTTIPAPIAFGVNWKHPLPLYYLILFFAALSYVAVVYVSRTPFGLALQGVRDNPRRMEAIGYNVTAHRVAAYAFAALIASIGGILMVWLNNQISPGSNGIEATIDLLDHRRRRRARPSDRRVYRRDHLRDPAHIRA